MITKDDFKDRAIDLVEKYFPKGKSKERGEAAVLVSELIIIDKEIKRALYARKTDTKENAGGNGREGRVSNLSAEGSTIRSRMPGKSADGATYRMGTRVLPVRPKGE